MLVRGTLVLWLLHMLAVLCSSASLNDERVTKVTGTVGSTVILPCFAKDLGDKTVSWIREKDMYILVVDKLTFTSDARFSPAETNDSEWDLKIKYLQYKDAGLYTCETTHVPGRKYQVLLEVVEPQAEISLDGESTVRAGTEFSLRCHGGQGDYFWFHNDVFLSNDGRHVIKRLSDSKVFQEYSRLTVQNVTTDDAGRYTCKIMDSTETYVDITVTDLPHPPNELHVTGVSFSAVEITWSYSDRQQNSQSSYVLEYRPDHSDEDFTEIKDIHSNSYNVEGLFPMTEYAFRVSAVNQEGFQGTPSHIVLVTTAALSFSLLRAVENGHLGVVKDLLELEADVDEGDGMYLKMASQMGHLNVVKFLLKAGADPDADEDGEAVQEAAKNGHIEVVRALLDAEADANVGDGMHHAVAKNYPEIVKLLHEHGSDVNKPLPERPWKNPETGANYGFGWTALHVAARWGQTSLVDLLYHLGSDLGAKDPNGDTPLHVAVKYPQIWFVRELLKYCPDLSLQNNDGKTVIDLVEDLPHAIYSSLSSEEGIQLRHLVANITIDKIKTSTNTEEAAAALEDEVEALVESNVTISDLVDAVASTDSHVDIVLQELFEDTVYLEIEDAFADHLCTSDGSGEWKAALDVQYAAVCVCVPGKGPTLELKPLEQCDSSSPHN